MTSFTNIFSPWNSQISSRASMLPTQDMGFPVCNQLTDYYYFYFFKLFSLLYPFLSQTVPSSTVVPRVRSLLLFLPSPTVLSLLLLSPTAPVSSHTAVPEPSPTLSLPPPHRDSISPLIRTLPSSDHPSIITRCVRRGNTGMEEGGGGEQHLVCY